MNKKHGKRNRTHNLRPRRPIQEIHDYNLMHIDGDHSDINEINEFTLMNMATEQYTIKKGLKIFKELGADATIKELKQLHD